MKNTLFIPEVKFNIGNWKDIYIIKKDIYNWKDSGGPIVFEEEMWPEKKSSMIVIGDHINIW